MLGFNRWQIFKTSAAAVLAVGTISLLLIYFIPAPPSTVTMATGNKGTSFEYFGQRYRDIFARSHVELKVRETDGAIDNIELLKNPNSGVQIGLAFGGISDGKPAPGVLSLGTVYTNPFWIFYSSDEPLDRLSQLKGKRIAVGPVGSGTRFSAERAEAASIPRRPRCFLSEEQRQSRHSMKAKRMSCGPLDRRMHRLSAHCCGIPTFDS
jgi:TRAP-type uncharacterized transport system substrate-binding protein